MYAEGKLEAEDGSVGIEGETQTELLAPFISLAHASWQKGID